MAGRDAIKDLQTLVETSVKEGGREGFIKAFNQKLGLETSERLFSDESGVTKLKTVTRFNAKSPRREFNHNEFSFGEVASAMLPGDWRGKFDASFETAQKLRFNALGSPTVTGDAPYTSLAIDVIYGLANARAFDPASTPELIADDFCETEELIGEGGFLIGKRVDFSNPIQSDMAKDSPPQKLKLTETRIHRNRPGLTNLELDLNKYFVLDDLTGQAMSAVDQYRLAALLSKEKRVADACLGIGGTGGYTFPGQQTMSKIQYIEAGLGGYPYQATANTNPAPENGKQVLNFVNCKNSDGFGLDNYRVLERAMLLLENLDPYVLEPIATSFEGMQMWVHPRAFMQAERILNAKRQWVAGPTAITSASGTMADGDNPLNRYGIQLKTSQIWAKRLTDVGIGSGGMSHAATDLYTTAGSALSLYLIGHYKKGLKYYVREPFTAMGLPISGDDIGAGTMFRQLFREFGAATVVRPQGWWRAYC